MSRKRVGAQLVAPLRFTYRVLRTPLHVTYRARESIHWRSIAVACVPRGTTRHSSAAAQETAGNPKYQTRFQYVKSYTRFLCRCAGHRGTSRHRWHKRGCRSGLSQIVARYIERLKAGVSSVTRDVERPRTAEHRIWRTPPEHWTAPDRRSACCMRSSARHSVASFGAPRGVEHERGTPITSRSR